MNLKRELKLVMEKHIRKILFTREKINKRVVELGKEITLDYKGKELVVVGVLKGANIFLADLIREINLSLYIDFIAVSSYGYSTESSGIVRILKDLDSEIENKHVLIIEDIVDTGLTLNYLLENFKTRRAKSLKICSLLDKPSRRRCNLHIDYIGFQIPDEFIVGYGIDYAERYRNLPYIGILKKDAF